MESTHQAILFSRCQLAWEGLSLLGGHLHHVPVWPLQCRRRSHGRSIPVKSLHISDSLQMAQMYCNSFCEEHKLIHQNPALPFISSLAVLASSWEANFTNPNPFGLLVILSVMMVAALKQETPAWVTTNNSRQDDYQVSTDLCSGK